MKSNTNTPVWHYNLSQELHYLALSLNRYKLLSVDTKLLDFIQGTPRDAPEAIVYDELKFNIITMHRDLKWVTFHGTYDFTYVLKLFTRETLSNTAQEFVAKASTYLDKVVDLKLAAKYFKGLKDVEVGLLSRILHVSRFGKAHNVDSDSLLIAQVYAKMTDHIEDGSLEGILYGLEDVKIRRKYKPYFMTPLPHPHPMYVQFVPCTFYTISFRPRIQSNTITPIWHYNSSQELHYLALSLNQYKLLSVNIELLDFIRGTPRDAPEAIVYDDFKFNVNNTNII
ncbi:hypothetical protein Q3G72_033593 [Acer saccharum]|nr:hypothetical protein Q3G72_033593 [Acer saccharum]